MIPPYNTKRLRIGSLSQNIFTKSTPLSHLLILNCHYRSGDKIDIVKILIYFLNLMLLFYNPDIFRFFK